jgi:polyhydroxybutyrate depolymerase
MEDVMLDKFQIRCAAVAIAMAVSAVPSLAASPEAQAPYATAASGQRMPWAQQPNGGGGDAGENRQVLLTSDGLRREYIVRRPDRASPLPTIIMLHGNGGQAQNAMRGSGLGQAAMQQGFAAVFPEGIDHGWNDGRPALAAEQRSHAGIAPDDVSFLKALVRELIDHGIADPARVYLAGFSNGAFMTYRMACEAAGTFAAIGTFEGNMPMAFGENCRPSAPLPVVVFSATEDPKVRYEGTNGPKGGLWSTERTVGFFRELNGCADRPNESQLPSPEQDASGVTLMQWTGCRGAPVSLYRIEGGAHRIPQSPFAADALWSFFKDKSRPSLARAAVPAMRPQQTTSAPAPQDRPATPSAEVARAPADAPLAGDQTEVTIESHGNQLAGCITRPAGAGPFPAIIYNHGSEKNPRRCGPPDLVKEYVDHGYLVFAFQRHGHGQSTGDYIGDLEKQINESASDPRARAQQKASLQDTYNQDVVDAVGWLSKRPEVDRGRMVMTGVSYGGIQTLLTAEKGLGLRAFIAFAPGAMSWKNEVLQQRLTTAVRNARAPIYLAQAQNDFSLGPSEVLGPMIRAKGGLNDAKVYPAFGTTPQEGHGGFAVGGGVAIWSPDVFAFLDHVLAAPGEVADSNSFATRSRDSIRR